MIVVLSYYSANGTDIKYLWNDFMMKLQFMHSCRERLFWKDFLPAVQQLHPQTTADVAFGVIVPLIGFASGFLSGKQDNF